MTGHAPLLPKWSYGLFQSKDRYKTQSEILDIASAIVAITYLDGIVTGLVLVEDRRRPHLQ